MYVEEMVEFIDDIEVGILLMMYDCKYQEIYVVYEQMKELYVMEVVVEIEYISYEDNLNLKQVINNCILEIEKEIFMYEQNIGVNFVFVDDSLLKGIVEEVRLLCFQKKNQWLEILISIVEMRVQVQKVVDFFFGKCGVGQIVIYDMYYVFVQ